ncbi:MAG TPA: oxidoreductase [Lapillicoccus sp.]|nr:oxidoreductase [Lapillicoccus sp.]
MALALRRSLAVLAATGLALVATQSAASAAKAPDLTAGRPSVSVSWQATPTGTTERFRGLSAVSSRVAWVSGTTGTVLRTTDGGATWTSVGPPGTSTLQFRDIEATSDRHAVILSIGEGTDSRIYVTDDGGASWTLAFQNTDPRAFYDCMAFSTPQRGLALSDPVDGAFRLQETTDGGHTWSLVDPAGMPPSLPNEFAFAASGTCLTAGQGQTTYLGSGGGEAARIFVSTDRGHTWSVTRAPLAAGPSAGVFSVRFRDRHNGIAVGGDFANPTSSLGNAAWSSDGGITWRPADVRPGGYRSGSAWLPQHRDVALAVGPSGSDVSSDAGRTWSSFDAGSFDSVECANDGACWASGEQGRVATLVVSRG